MIIQCQRCLTKFRFDDALMAGEGVWVRCSRCRQVFFEENPASAGTAGTEPPRFYPPEPEPPRFYPPEPETPRPMRMSRGRSSSGLSRRRVRRSPICRRRC